MRRSRRRIAKRWAWIASSSSHARRDRHTDRVRRGVRQRRRLPDPLPGGWRCYGRAACLAACRGGLRLSRAHELLAERYRVIALEVPGFGTSAANEGSQSYLELAATLASALRQLGLERFNLWGTSFGGAVALWLAIGAPETIQALVLEAPGAILPAGGIRPSGSPEEMRRRLFAHPERLPLVTAPDPAIVAKQRALLERLPRPSREESEAKLDGLRVPTLVVFGTQDRVVPAAMGRVYREKMPNCQYVLVYDAGHEVGAERPEAFSSLVSDFLERREAFIVNSRSSLLNP